MASSPQSYQKRQRELRKKERKAEKQAIRHGRSAAKAEESDDGPDEDALLEEFRILNEKFAAGEVDEARLRVPQGGDLPCDGTGRSARTA